MGGLEILKNNHYRTYVTHKRIYRNPSGVLILLTKSESKSKIYKNWELQQYGGQTVVTVYRKLSINGKKLATKQVADCSFKDPYCKMIGRSIAVGRALEYLGLGNDNQV